MDLKLVRLDYFADGIFGEIRDASDRTLFVTLEHSYKSDSGQYLPKTPAGSYTCVRGQHRLATMEHPFEAFEITNVPGHTNILFHVGNYNKDSEGCVLIGTDQLKLSQLHMITNSKAAFQRFMDLQKGNNSFTIKIT